MPKALVAVPGGCTFALEGSTVAELRAALEKATGERREEAAKEEEEEEEEKLPLLLREAKKKTSRSPLLSRFLSLSLLFLFPLLSFSPFIQASSSASRPSATSKGKPCLRTRALAAKKRRRRRAERARDLFSSASAARAAPRRWSRYRPLLLPQTTTAASA